MLHHSSKAQDMQQHLTVQAVSLLRSLLEKLVAREHTSAENVRLERGPLRLLDCPTVLGRGTAALKRASAWAPGNPAPTPPLTEEHGDQEPQETTQQTDQKSLF